MSLLMVSAFVLSACAGAAPAAEPTKAPEATMAPEATKSPEATATTEPTKAPETTATIESMVASFMHLGAAVPKVGGVVCPFNF